MSFEIKKKSNYDPGYPSLHEKTKNEKPGIKRKLSILAISATLAFITISCDNKVESDMGGVLEIDMDFTADEDIQIVDEEIVDEEIVGNEAFDLDIKVEEDIIPVDEELTGDPVVDMDIQEKEDDISKVDEDFEDIVGDVVPDDPTSK